MRLLDWIKGIFKKRTYKKVGKQVEASALKREMRRRELEKEVINFIRSKRSKGRLSAYQSLRLANKRFAEELKLERMSLALYGKQLKVRSRVA